MPATRRKYANSTAAQIIKKIAAPPQCEACTDLKYTPSFVEAIMATNKITANQVQAWYHLRKHSIYS